MQNGVHPSEFVFQKSGAIMSMYGVKFDSILAPLCIHNVFVGHMI